MQRFKTQACFGLMSTFRRQLAIQYRRNEFKQRQENERPDLLSKAESRSKPKVDR